MIAESSMPAAHEHAAATGPRSDPSSRSTQRPRTATLLLAVPAAGVVVLTLQRLVPYDRVTPVAQLISLTPWVGLAAALLLTAALVLRSWVVAGVLAAMVALHAVWLAPFFVGGDVLTDGDDPIVVLTVNALYGQADAEQIVDTVRIHEVDVLAVVELTPELVDRLGEAGLEKLLPFAVDAARPGAGGSGLWSATVLTEPETGEGSTFAMPSGVVQVDGHAVRVTAVHTYPPVPGSVGLWADELDALGKLAHADPARQILLGDFNATYDHATYRALLGERFVDATRAAGDGLNLSWPADRWTPPLADLDHVVMDEHMVAGGVESIQIAGTDHRALLVQVAVRAIGGR